MDYRYRRALSAPLLAGIAGFFTQRIFGASRAELLAGGLGALNHRAEDSRADKLAALCRALADIQARQDGLVHILEAHDDPTGAVSARVRDRLGELEAARRASTTSSPPSKRISRPRARPHGTSRPPHAGQPSSPPDNIRSTARGPTPTVTIRCSSKHRDGLAGPPRQPRGRRLLTRPAHPGDAHHQQQPSVINITFYPR